MIYLDNSATSYPKPQCVIEGINEALLKLGANPGRGSYEMAIETSEAIYTCRKNIASYFNVPKIENVIFTHNCTMAMNMSIKGVVTKGCNFIISDLEHNAVLRPLAALKQAGICNYKVAKVDTDIYQTLKNFEKNIDNNTIAIICTGASNVFGIVPPYRALASLAHKYNLLMIVDYSQIAGVIPLDINETGIDIMCCSGHKALYGPTGVGLLIINNDIVMNTIVEGGTGSNSKNLNQPLEYPDRFESGTQNIVGIIGLSKSINYLGKIKSYEIYRKEMNLLRYLQKYLMSDNKFEIYTNLFNNKNLYAPIMSFNIKGKHSEEVAALLSEDGIAVRAGFHCAPLAHEKFGTIECGTVRVSPSIFTEKNDIDFLINSLRKFAN